MVITDQGILVKSVVSRRLFHHLLEQALGSQRELTGRLLSGSTGS